MVGNPIFWDISRGSWFDAKGIHVHLGLPLGHHAVGISVFVVSMWQDDKGDDYISLQMSQEIVNLSDLGESFIFSIMSTLQGTNISLKNGILKMIFLFPRWDMLIPWRVTGFSKFTSTKAAEKEKSHHDLSCWNFLWVPCFWRDDLYWFAAFWTSTAHCFGSFLVFFWSVLHSTTAVYTEFFCLDLCDDLWIMAWSFVQGGRA